MDRGKRSLLVVDGSATYLFYLGMLLKRLEYTVHSLTTAEDALQTMADFLPALVITDIALPKMNGISMLKQMKQSSRLKKIPVIIHTSESDPALKEICMNAGCAVYIRKPSDPDTLYKAIQAATEPTPRQNIRIDISLVVEVGDRKVPGEVVRTEEVTTLSEGGLYIKTATPEPVHTLIPIKIFIRNRQVNATAAVQYSSAKIGGQHKVPGMGMKFVSISPEDKAFIREFIKEQIEQGLSLERGIGEK